MQVYQLLIMNTTWTQHQNDIHDSVTDGRTTMKWPREFMSEKYNDVFV